MVKLDGCLDGSTDGLMDGSMDGWTDLWTDRWMKCLELQDDARSPTGQRRFKEAEQSIRDGRVKGSQDIPLFLIPCLSTSNQQAKLWCPL